MEYHLEGCRKAMEKESARQKKVQESMQKFSQRVVNPAEELYRRDQAIARAKVRKEKLKEIIEEVGNHSETNNLVTNLKKKGIVFFYVKSKKYKGYDPTIRVFYDGKMRSYTFDDLNIDTYHFPPLDPILDTQIEAEQLKQQAEVKTHVVQQ